MPTITTVDATWDTGVTMDAAELRRADSAMFLGDGSNNGVRGGVVYHGPGSLLVTVNGSDQVTVAAGAFVIPSSTGLGVYRGALSAATAATAISARNATNPRIDIIAIQVAGASAVVKTIDGTPGASPSAPALPAQHIEVGRINVPATGGGAVTVDSTWRVYAASLGATIYVPTLARLPGSGNLILQRAIALDTGAEHIWDGTAWNLSIRTIAGGLGANMTGSITSYRRPGLAIVAWDLTATLGQGSNVAIASAGVVPTASINGHTTNLTSGAVVASYISGTTGFLQLRAAITAGQNVVGSMSVPLAT